MKTTNVVETVLKARDEMSGPLGAASKGAGGLSLTAAAAAAAVAALAVAAAAAAKKLVQMSVEAAKAGDDAAKASQRLGLMTEEYTALTFAAERYGASQSSITTAMRTMARAAVEAADGMEMYADVFEQLGVDVLDRTGELKDMNVLFSEVAEGIRKTEGQTKRLGLAQQILGRGATDLMVMLNDGAAGIAAMSAEAEKYNAVISTEFGKASESFVDAMTNMKGASDGAKREVAEGMLPAMTDGINNLAAALADPAVLKGLTALGQVAGQVTKVVFEIVAVAGGVVGGGIGGLGEGLKAWWKYGRTDPAFLAFLQAKDAADEYGRGLTQVDDNVIAGDPYAGGLGPFLGKGGGREQNLLGIGKRAAAPAVGMRETTDATEEWAEALGFVEDKMTAIELIGEGMVSTSEQIAANFAESMSWAFASIVDGHEAMIANLGAAWKNLIREILYNLVKSGIMKLVMTTLLPGVGGFAASLFSSPSGFTAGVGAGGSDVSWRPTIPGPGGEMALAGGRGGGTVNITAFGGTGSGRSAAAQFLADLRRNGVG